MRTLIEPRGILPVGTLLKSCIEVRQSRIAHTGDPESPTRRWDLTITDEPRVGLIEITGEPPRLGPIDVTWKITGATLVGSLSYTARIEYTDHGRNDTARTFGQSTSLSFTVEFGQTVVQGGTFHLEVSASLQTDTGELVEITDNARAVIRGSNPAKQVVRKFLADAFSGSASSVEFGVRLQVIAFKESRFQQFDNGLPKFGPPNGFGIMQLDTPPPTAREIWDWKENVATGMGLFARKQLEVWQHFENVYAAHPDAPHLTPAQMKLSLYQYYNGGWYWEWKPTTKTWQRTDTTGYADDAVRIENLVNRGTPPSGWND